MTGPISPDTLQLIYPYATPESTQVFSRFFNMLCPAWGIDTDLRFVHFLAQVGHESGQFRCMAEIATGFAYEGRADLGNTQPGDGMKFKGRGLIQITGRTNYQAFADECKLPYVMETPWVVAQHLDLAALSAVWFWRSHGLNALADEDDLRAITRRINGGYNGLADRTALLARAKSAIMWGK